MKRMRAVALLAILISAVSVTNAFGCSYADGALFPSNYDRVKEAEAIVLADALSLDATPPVDLAYSMPKLTIRAVETIKGNFTGGVVPVTPLSSCFGYDYKSAVDQRVLLFLYKDQEGKWSVSGSPLGSIDGQASGANGPWEAVVRHYARIDRLNDYEREKVELRSLQQAARMDRRNYPAGLDKDIEEHFTRPYPTKSYKDLFDLYARGTREQRLDALWAMAKGKHKEARALMQSLMRSSDFESYTGPVTAYVNATQDYSSIDALGGAYLGMKEKEKRWPIMWSLIQLAREQDMGLMLAVLKWADIEEAGRLSAWFVRHPDDDATQIFRKLVGSQFLDSGRWELSLSLAALGDKAVIDYARETIASTNDVDRTARFSLGDNPALKRGLALEMLGRSPLPLADTLAREVISRGNLKDMETLSQGFLASIDPNRWQRLRAVPDLKAVDEVGGHWIRQTLENLAKQGDPDAKEFLERLK